MGLLRKRTHDLKHEDRLYVGRTSAPIDIRVASASGSRLVDVKGRSFLDFQSGWCVTNLGWNHPQIVERLNNFSGPSYIAPGLLYEPWVELAKQLAEIAPGNLKRSFRAVGGTEAVEIALLIAITATDRKKIVSIEGAYHGNSIAARSIGEADLDVVVQGCKKLAPPLDAKAIDRLETLLKGRDVACVILEPVIMNLAVEVPTDDFLKGARELCDRYGTLLIFDEVACGFGRTGRMFASEHSGVVPDIMTVAKAITNGHVPLAATITTPAIADMLEDELSFYSTFGWHPLAVEAALAVLEIWRDESPAIFENVARKSGEIVGRLLAMDWKTTAEIRSKGMAFGVKLEEGYPTRIAERCRKRGLIVGDEDEYLMIMPPLNISDDDMREGLDILQRCIGS